MFEGAFSDGLMDLVDLKQAVFKIDMACLERSRSYGITPLLKAHISVRGRVAVMSMESILTMLAKKNKELRKNL